MATKGKTANLMPEMAEAAEAGRLAAMLREIQLKDQSYNNVYGEFLTSDAVMACQYGVKKGSIGSRSLRYTTIGGTEVLVDKDTMVSGWESKRDVADWEIGGVFGVCTSPIVTDSTSRTVRIMLSECFDGKGGTATGPICRMQLGNKWGSLANEVSVYDAAIHDYRKIPTTNSYLVCHYGQGCVYPVDSGQRVTVNSTQGATQIADKYYASERMKIRATPNGQQIDGTRVFIPGAIVKVHESKETQKVAGSDSMWIKVYYDVNKIGWVGKELLENLPEPVAGYNFKYNWDKSQYVNKDFKDKVNGISQSLGIDPDDLMAVMAFESGLNPAQKNMAGGSATGLVQFMPDVAAELHTTTAELATMPGVEQLDYVFGYFYVKKGKMKTLGDIYMRVLCPEAVGESDDYVIYSTGNEYAANAGLDANKDGKITKKEAVQSVINTRNNYI